MSTIGTITAVFGALIGAVVVAVIAWAAARLLESDGAVIPNCLAAGAIEGLIAFFTPRLAVSVLWLALVFMAAVCLMFAVLILWWLREGSTLLEMVPFVLLALILWWLNKSTAEVASALLLNAPFFGSLVTAIPTLVLIGTIGCFIVNWLLCMANVEEARKNNPVDADYQRMDDEDGD